MGRGSAEQGAFHAVGQNAAVVAVQADGLHGGAGFAHEGIDVVGHVVDGLGQLAGLAPLIENQVAGLEVALTEGACYPDRPSDGGMEAYGDDKTCRRADDADDDQRKGQHRHVRH